MRIFSTKRLSYEKKRFQWTNLANLETLNRVSKVIKPGKHAMQSTMNSPFK